MIPYHRMVPTKGYTSAMIPYHRMVPTKGYTSACMCLSLQNTSSIGVYDVIKDNSSGEMTKDYWPQSCCCCWEGGSGRTILFFSVVDYMITHTAYAFGLRPLFHRKSSTQIAWELHSGSRQYHTTYTHTQSTITHYHRHTCAHAHHTIPQSVSALLFIDYPVRSRANRAFLLLSMLIQTLLQPLEVIQETPTRLE